MDGEGHCTDVLDHPSRFHSPEYGRVPSTFQVRITFLGRRVADEKVYWHKQKHVKAPNPQASAHSALMANVRNSDCYTQSDQNR